MGSSGAVLAAAIAAMAAMIVIRWPARLSGEAAPVPPRAAPPTDLPTGMGEAAGGPAGRAEGSEEALAFALRGLPLGVAAFGRDRRLVLANPAFAEATGLDWDRDGEALAGRPTLSAVVARLGEARLLPDLAGLAPVGAPPSAVLRAAIAAAERGELGGAAIGPDGRALRVSARAEPGGALALLVEDRTDELALARRFRAELDCARAALDGIEEAVAVFAASGALRLTNAAYDALWGAPGMADPTLDAESRRWAARAGPSPAWAALRAGAEAAPREVQGPAGGALLARVATIAGGAQLVAFRPVPSPLAPALPTLLLDRRPA